MGPRGRNHTEISRAMRYIKFRRRNLLKEGKIVMPVIFTNDLISYVYRYVVKMFIQSVFNVQYNMIDIVNGAPFVL